MERQLKDGLTSALMRALYSEPTLSIDEAIDRLGELLPDGEFLFVDAARAREYLREFAAGLKRNAVMNPQWLAEVLGFRFHFFLIDAQPGWLGHLMKQCEELSQDISSYILYGQWDSLFIMCGTEAELEPLLVTLQESVQYRFVHFSSRKVPLFYRYVTKDLENSEADVRVVEQLVEDYDAPGLIRERNALEERGVLLGPSWSQETESRSGLSAFVGIRLRGGIRDVSAADVLAVLQANEAVRGCMIHLFEVETGLPFHYLAKVSCADSDELNEVTNAIGLARVATVALEGSTFLIASGRQKLPPPRPRPLAAMSPPDLGNVEELAASMLVRRGQDAIRSFNQLGSPIQLAVLKSLAEFEAELETKPWDDIRNESVQSAIDAFVSTSLQGPERARPAGAVIEMAAAVEGYLKHALRLMVEQVYGRDYARAQKELRLPTKDFRRLTLGKLSSALRVAKEHADFVHYSQSLTSEQLDSLDHFTELRNRWAHAGIPPGLSHVMVIDESGRTLVAGLRLLRWIAVDILAAVSSDTAQTTEAIGSLPAKREGREPGIFVSHSSTNKDFAEQVARALQALGYSVWFAGWAIAPGDSIVQRIGAALAQSDTLLVLLSKDSVASPWVQQELSTALSRQLGGQDVRIVPVLIEECEIPPVIRDIRYVDMTAKFQDGFLELLRALQQRRM